MPRDTQKSAAYFENLLPQYIEGIESLKLALEDGSMPLPDEQATVSNDLFELQLMYSIASYSAGESLDALKPKITEILKAKNFTLKKQRPCQPDSRCTVNGLKNCRGIANRERCITLLATLMLFGGCLLWLQRNSQKIIVWRF